MQTLETALKHRGYVEPFFIQVETQEQLSLTGQKGRR